MERAFDALAVSRGTAVGQAICLHGRKRQFFRTDVSTTDVKPEIDRFNNAIAKARTQLQDLLAKDCIHDNAKSIFDVQLLILEHSGLAAEVEAIIREQCVNAEWALGEVTDAHVAKQTTVADPHLREKAVDIQDVTERVLTALMGHNDVYPDLAENSIVIASIIKPSTVIELSRHKPRAIVTEHGGWTSHAFIMARELGIPAVTGISDVLRLVEDGDKVAVDGYTGKFYLEPDADTVKRLEDRTIAASAAIGVHNGNNLPLRTLDGCEITIRANIEQAEAVESVRASGAKGIGLLRSEFLFATLAGGFPSEERQYEAYRALVAALGDESVWIRTFDFSSDQVSFNAANRESNPALGLRAIRLSLANAGQFRVQLRAILRAAASGNASIVLPMVSGVDEIEISRAMIDEETADLRAAGLDIPDVAVGVMIEVPSAVLTIDDIVTTVDFICVGTNDLVQYLLAVDRDNEAVAKHYQTLHPAVLTSISTIIKAAHAAGIPSVICGEMAGSPFYTPLLVGIGAREFSMNINSIRAIRDVIAGISLEESSELARRAASLRTAAGIDHLLRDFYSAKWPHLFPPQFLTLMDAERK